MLSLEDFIRTAAHRGRQLSVREVDGRFFLMEGEVYYPLPLRSRTGRLAKSFVYSACLFFVLDPIDFGMDPPPDD